MNRTQYRVMLIKQIHVSHRYRDYFIYQREEYEELLHEHFGVTSSKHLNIDQLVMLCDWMNFRIDILPVQKKKADLVTPAQLTTIRGMWSQYAKDTSDEALLKFVKKIIGEQYLHIKSLKLEEAQKIIPVLDKMQHAKGR